MDRPKAILLDFYGTIVEEDDPVIASVRQTIYATATANNPADPKAVGAYWWALFSDLCATSAGQTFATQRELERRSLQGTLEYFGSDADGGHTQQLFEYSRRRRSSPTPRNSCTRSARPVCIVSNIDRSDIEAAINHHNLTVDLLVTSEDARAYKPRPRTLPPSPRPLGLAPAQVLHVGDSLTADVRGANALGIPVAWVNRKAKTTPPQTHVRHETPDLESLAHLLTRQR